MMIKLYNIYINVNKLLYVVHFYCLMMIKEAPSTISITQDAGFTEPQQIISSTTCKYGGRQDFSFKGHQPENMLTNIHLRRFRLLLLIALEYLG
jgi:hypothetical protein